MFQTKVVEKIKTHILCSVTLFRKSCRLWVNVEKYGSRTGHRWQYSKANAFCMLDDSGYRHTIRICNTYFFPTTTTIARTRHNVTLYVHWLSCYLCLKEEFCKEAEVVWELWVGKCYAKCPAGIRTHRQQSILILSCCKLQSSLMCWTGIRHIYIYIYIYIYTPHIYTGCNRRNGPDFGKVFLMLKYTDIVYFLLGKSPASVY